MPGRLRARNRRSDAAVRGARGAAPDRDSPNGTRRGERGRRGSGRARDVRRPGLWGSMPRWLKALAVAGAALAVVLVVVGIAAWNLWGRFDDAADIQGTWGTSAGDTIVITSDELQLSSGVVYDYTIDTQNKTIDFSLGNATGHASYRFGGDRSQLVLDEVDDTDYLVYLGIVPDEDLQRGTTGDGVSVLFREGALPEATTSEDAAEDDGQTEERENSDSSNG